MGTGIQNMAGKLTILFPLHQVAPTFSAIFVHSTGGQTRCEARCKGEGAGVLSAAWVDTEAVARFADQ